MLNIEMLEHQKIQPDAPELHVMPGFALSILAHKYLAVPLPALTLQLEKYMLHVPLAGQLILAIVGAYLELVVPLKFLK